MKNEQDTQWDYVSVCCNAEVTDDKCGRCDKKCETKNEVYDE